MPVSEKLDALVEELRELDHAERMQLLVEMARGLPPLPERLEPLRDDAHRVAECVAQVFLFVELEGDRVRVYADVPESAPATRGFASLLVEALDGAPADEVRALDDSLIERSGLRQSIGMQRLNGFYAMIRRLRREVARQLADGPGVPR